MTVFRTGSAEAGEMRPLLAKTYPLEAIREAQAAFLEKSHIGNIALLPQHPAEAHSGL